MANNTHRAGFTLLEVLAALAIFSIIIVMMGNIFHQSSIAWEGGTRKAQGAIEARVILANIAQELSHAVHMDGDALDSPDMRDKQQYGHDRTYFTFISLGRKREIATTDSYRDAHRITYNLNNGVLKRSEQLLSSDADYAHMSPGFAEVAPAYVVATNILGIRFRTPQSGVSTGVEQHPDEGLPRWVEVELWIGRLDDVSGVAAVSWGPNGDDDGIGPDSDDIRTY